MGKADFQINGAMNAAAPEGTPPRRIRYIIQKPPRPTMPRRGPEAGYPRKFLVFMEIHYAKDDIESPITEKFPKLSDPRSFGRPFVR
jgi:hypothetical protein